MPNSQTGFATAAVALLQLAHQQLHHSTIAAVNGTSQTHCMCACACAEYGSSNFMQNIQSAFTTSSAALLQLLQQELGLNRTLAALKHYFLLDQGDLLVSFLDTAEEELSKPASQVSVIRLQSLLDLGKHLGDSGASNGFQARPSGPIFELILFLSMSVTGASCLRQLKTREHGVCCELIAYHMGHCSCMLLRFLRGILTSCTQSV